LLLVFIEEFGSVFKIKSKHHIRVQLVHRQVISIQQVTILGFFNTLAYSSLRKLAISQVNRVVIFRRGLVGLLSTHIKWLECHKTSIVSSID
jgi:hypothetical protein